MTSEKVAFLFPGQGSQYVGMGEDFYQTFNAAKEVFTEASDSLDQDLANVCFNASKEELNKTENTQPAILTASIATLKVLMQEYGIRPVVLAGHSLGEYSALVAAGVVSFYDAVQVVRARGKFMQTAVPLGCGTMAAVLGMKKEKLENICRETTDPSREKVVEPANYNCPGQVVISGHVKAVDEATIKARDEGASRAVKLPVSAPFHCSLMEPAARRLAEKFCDVKVSEPQIPVISNVDADTNYTVDTTSDLLVRQVSSAVRWEESMHLMVEQGVTRIIEIGPGRVLSGLMRRINRRIKTHTVENVADLKKLAEVFG
ncbi:MAG: [acyl-carrier-protein] S-malonyltransferase [Deltaproteobacteria bacterium]|nr:MAG: [acyl-carrier-protein] S-malonyltransferase [Deltaproteobacteria bacterium]